MKPQKKATAKATPSSPPNPLEGASFGPRTLEAEPAAPLFSREESDAWQKRFKDWDAAYNADKATWSDREALMRELLHETRKRVLARPQALTNALLVLVGARGKKYVEFYSAFQKSDAAEISDEIAKHDTPENRRALHTLLRALAEVPKSWARSAFIRFLRDQGKQAQAKYAYPGKGMFGKDYGWKGDEIKAVCEVLMGGRFGDSISYSAMFITYADVANEISKDEAARDKPGSYLAEYVGVRTERNRKLIDKVCEVLESRGLASEPEREVREPKAPRKPKEFSPGDVIRKGTLRDLPLPALVKVPIERSTGGHAGPWTKSEVEWVVARLWNSGRFLCYRAVPQKGEGQRVAHRGDCLSRAEPKDFLYGATYLGPWKGKIDERELKYKFLYRIPKGE